MTIETALTKLDKLTINQLKHFIQLLTSQIIANERSYRFLQKSVSCWRDKPYYEPRELLRARVKFEIELKVRGYWKKCNSSAGGGINDQGTPST